MLILKINLNSNKMLKGCLLYKLFCIVIHYVIIIKSVHKLYIYILISMIKFYINLL